MAENLQKHFGDGPEDPEVGIFLEISPKTNRPQKNQSENGVYPVATSRVLICFNTHGHPGQLGETQMTF